MYLSLETKRLQIRPLNLTDIAFILEFVNSDGWLTFIGDRNVITESDAELYIQNILESPTIFYHVFESKVIGKPMGVVTLIQRQQHNFPDIGFATLPKFQKNGYTLEACKCYLDAVMASGKYKNILAITRPDNHKSIHLLNKLGLAYDSDTKENDRKISIYSLTVA
jgi:RimJ/RimL family protein N-acetyltransferase